MSPLIKATPSTKFQPFLLSRLFGAIFQSFRAILQIASADSLSGDSVGSIPAKSHRDIWSDFCVGTLLSYLNVSAKYRTHPSSQTSGFDFSILDSDSANLAPCGHRSCYCSTIFPAIRSCNLADFSWSPSTPQYEALHQISASFIDSVIFWDFCSFPRRRLLWPANTVSVPSYP